MLVDLQSQARLALLVTYAKTGYIGPGYLQKIHSRTHSSWISIDNCGEGLKDLWSHLGGVLRHGEAAHTLCFRIPGGRASFKLM